MNNQVDQQNKKPNPNELQNQFLNKCRTEKILVNIFMVSGIKLTGKIRSFDSFTLLLNDMLLFKSAIASIQPAKENK